MHAVRAKSGIPVIHSDIFGRGGGIWLDQLVLPQPYAGKVASLRALIGVLDREIARLEEQAAGAAARRPGVRRDPAAAGHRPGAGRGDRRGDR